MSGVLLAALLFSGCATHEMLQRSTALTTSTVMDIQYQVVLRNIAKLSLQPEALPDHSDLADGVVQVNDKIGFGEGGGFTSFAGGSYGFGLDQFGPLAERQVTEQWGVDATTDPQRLADLQELYRAALGLPPLPPLHAIIYLRRQQAEAREERNERNEEGQGGASSGDGQRRVPIEILLTDVPAPGWYRIGSSKEVPEEACYVGCYSDTCAWVLQDGLRSLSRLTMTVLNVVKLKPGEKSGAHGLAVPPAS